MVLQFRDTLGTGRDDLISGARIYLTAGRMGRIAAGCVKSRVCVLGLGKTRLAARSCSCDVTVDMRCTGDVRRGMCTLPSKCKVRQKTTSSCIPEKVQAEKTRQKISGQQVL